MVSLHQVEASGEAAQCDSECTKLSVIIYNCVDKWLSDRVLFPKTSIDQHFQSTKCVNTKHRLTKAAAGFLLKTVCSND
jgi:hypothetical protein